MHSCCNTEPGIAHASARDARSPGCVRRTTNAEEKVPFRSAVRIGPRPWNASLGVPGRARLKHASGMSVTSPWTGRGFKLKPRVVCGKAVVLRGCGVRGERGSVPASRSTPQRCLNVSQRTRPKNSQKKHPAVTRQHLAVTRQHPAVTRQHPAVTQQSPSSHPAVTRHPAVTFVAAAPAAAAAAAAAARRGCGVVVVVRPC